MALRMTYQREPITLSDPMEIEEPKPVRGCETCQSAMEQWQRASQPGLAHDLTRAVDLAIEIRRHPHNWKLDHMGQRVPR
ncbi:hypothetical protein AB0E81_11070 [Streptomyces sp. NPDC033538]|uniref:hypothetical protein n=1 Tax=Streptomyces sp. NPDC033538 TaxID=3155367 RepID=UPI00340FA860